MKTTSVVTQLRNVVLRHCSSASERRSKPYVISEDIDVLLGVWAKKTGFTIPDSHFFTEKRSAFYSFLEQCLVCENGANPVHSITGHELRDGIRNLVSEFPVVISVDPIYTPSKFPIVHITRMMDENFHKIGTGSRTHEPICEQLRSLPTQYRVSPVAICDDVVYGGESIIDLIEACEKEGIVVNALVVGISIQEGIDAIYRRFPHVRFYSVVEYDSVLDEICERDFWIGVPHSGRLVGTLKNGVPMPSFPETGIPYVSPFGRPDQVAEWSSLKPDRVPEWSRACLSWSIELWEEVERLSERTVRCSDIERIPIGFKKDNSSFLENLRRSLHKIS